MDKLIHNSKHLELNEVTHYSKWIEKFLKNQIKTKIRTNQDNNREYNDDKWGGLLARIDAKNITIETADELYYGDETTVCIVENKLYHTSALAARNYYHKLIFKYLETIAGDAPVVELGAGYGTVILNYADMLNKAGIKRELYAFEFTENGQECIRRLAAESTVKVGFCDFNLPFSPTEIPENSVIITSMSFMMLPVLKREFFFDLLKLKPKCIISFESVIDFCEDSLLGMLQHRYILENDYNRNYYDILTDLQDKGYIKIREIQKNIFAENFLCPTSLICWEPVY